MGSLSRTCSRPATSSFLHVDSWTYPSHNPSSSPFTNVFAVLSLLRPRRQNLPFPMAI